MVVNSCQPFTYSRFLRIDLMVEPTLESQDKSGAQGDERMRQFVELYSQHYSRLQYFLMALAPTSHDATDILQETSLVLWKKFDSFEIGTDFMAWACRIARFQVLKQHQRNNRVPKLFESNVLDLLAKDAEEAASRHNVQLDTLQDCIEKLPENDRKLIRRRYEPDSSVKVLATDIGRNPNSVSKSLGRIRKSLLECVKRNLPAEWSY